MRKHLTSFKVIVLAAVLSLGLSYIYAQWAPPVGGPNDPGSNVYAPINTGPVAQVKEGDLSVENLFVTGNFEATGSVKGGLLCIGEDCRAEWPDAPAEVEETSDAFANERIKDVVTSEYGGTTCALTYDGEVYCTGYNSHGQVGLGDKSRRTFFTLTPLTSDVTKIIGNVAGFCALKGDRIGSGGELIPGAGTVHCWGYGGQGQIGDGANVSKLVPTNVVMPAGERAIDIATNKAYTVSNDTYIRPTNCMLTESKKVYCWGYNRWGQVGDGTTTNRNIPTLVRDVVDARAIRMGGGIAGVSCAIIDNGSEFDLADDFAKCWGYNQHGQLGTGVVDDPASTDPTAVLPNGVTQYFQSTPQPVQRLVSNSPQVMGGIIDLQVSNGMTGTHVCAIVVDPASPQTVPKINPTDADPTGNIYCWGYNLEGQLGTSINYLTENANPYANIVQVANGTPSRVDDLPIVAARKIIMVSSGSDGAGSTCALLNDTDVNGNLMRSGVCWGRSYRGQLGTGYSGLQSGPTADNRYAGIKYYSTSTPRYIVQGRTSATGPVNRFPLRQIVDISSTHWISGSGGPFVCALVASSPTNMIGQSRCWGYNEYYQVANNAANQYAEPVTTLSNFTYSKIATGGAWACGITNAPTSPAERLKCWGRNHQGQLGLGSTITRIATPSSPQ